MVRDRASTPTVRAAIMTLVLAAPASMVGACAPQDPSGPRSGTAGGSATGLAPGDRTETVDRGVYDLAVSPDGETLAFGLLGRIWLLPVDGGEARQLTPGGGWDHHPAWSPDGAHLAYARDTPASSEIVLHTFATGTSRTLYGRSPADVTGGRSWGVVYPFGEIRFRPASEALYFVDFRSGIWSVDAGGTSPAEPVQVVTGSERLGRPGITESSSFAFSPDGRSLVVERDTTDMWTHLHVTSVDSISFSQATEAERVRNTEVEWSPDGGSIAYIEQAGGREGISVRDLATGAFRRIELGPFNGRELVLHPDGHRALVVSGRRLFTVDLETEAISPIPFEATLSLPARASGDLVITNARLFDATGADVVEDATVEVRDGRISAVTTGEYRGGEDVRVIDARGRFLMPGLVEAHTHLSARIQSLSMGGVPARYGVTSGFDAGSYLPETLNLRDAVELGVVPGPRIYTAGPTIDGPGGRARPLTIANVSDPAGVRELVGELADQGVDAIKLYAFLEPDVVAAAIEAAHARGLPVIGDQITTPWDDALEAGIDGLVHLFDHKWRFVSLGPEAPPDDPFAVVDPDSVVMDRFFTRVAERGAMFDPTAMSSSQFYFDSEAFAAALHDGDGETEAVHRARVIAEILRAMHRHGVEWVAGTDAGASALLHELAIYDAIGIPRADILRTATANVARWLRKDDFGTVEPGKRADLILVEGNPLERIRDLENIVLVVQDGRVVVER